MRGVGVVCFASGCRDLKGLRGSKTRPLSDQSTRFQQHQVLYQKSRNGLLINRSRCVCRWGPVQVDLRQVPLHWSVVHYGSMACWHHFEGPLLWLPSSFPVRRADFPAHLSISCSCVESPVLYMPLKEQLNPPPEI